MCSHRSNFFEASAFTKHILDTFTDDDISRKECVSRKIVERRRIYEWAVLMFQEEIQRVASKQIAFHVPNISLCISKIPIRSLAALSAMIL